MSAGCVPLAYAAGGPCEIIEDGVSGFLYDSSDLLLSKTAVMLEAGTEAYRIPIARRAAAAARRYSAEVFADAVRDLVREAGLMPAQSPPEGVLSG
jgi:glycosyltransferase involved in cell wall biosynthesis